MSLLSENITFLRKRAGINQNDFAEKIKVSRTTLSHYENDRFTPNEAVIKKIADEFKVSVTDLQNTKLSETYVLIEEQKSISTKSENLIPLLLSKIKMLPLKYKTTLLPIVEKIYEHQSTIEKEKKLQRETIEAQQKTIALLEQIGKQDN